MNCPTRSSKGNLEGYRKSGRISCRTEIGAGRLGHRQMSACKIADFAFISRSAASFVITPLVPGFPSLDVKPHSPGGTRRSKGRTKKTEGQRPPGLSHFLIRNSSFILRRYANPLRSFGDAEDSC